jgi:hypothetical protein
MSTTMKHRARNRGVVAVGTLTAGLLLVLGTGSPAQASVVSTVGLGTADSYEILAGSTITNTGSTMINNGDVGLSPGSSVTGFPPAVINNGVIHAADAQAQQAQADLITAYNDAAGRTPAAAIVGDLGSQTLAPGVYKGGAVGLTGALTLSGDANSVWIFQAASTLITASASSVVFAAAGDSGTPARLAATGVNPTPGLVTAAALFLVGGVLLVESRFRRRRAGNPEGEFRKSRRLG